jgi:hypothetical protein
MWEFLDGALRSHVQKEEKILQKQAYTEVGALTHHKIGLVTCA